jgi:hypothetical protein
MLDAARIEVTPPPGHQGRPPTRRVGARLPATPIKPRHRHGAWSRDLRRRAPPIPVRAHARVREAASGTTPSATTVRRGPGCGRSFREDERFLVCGSAGPAPIVGLGAIRPTDAIFAAAPVRGAYHRAALHCGIAARRFRLPAAPVPVGIELWTQMEDECRRHRLEVRELQLAFWEEDR